MRTVFLASLRTHARRYLAAAIAVIVSVGFVVVIGVLTSGARAGFMENAGAPYRGADHVISPAIWPGSQLDLDEVIAFTERHGENAAAIRRGSPPAHLDGRPLSRLLVAPIARSPELRWQQLVTGHFPATEGEAVLHLEAWTTAKRSKRDQRVARLGLHVHWRRTHDGGRTAVGRPGGVGSGMPSECHRHHAGVGMAHVAGRGRHRLRDGAVGLDDHVAGQSGW